MNRCNICIEEDCKGKKNCHCDTCVNLARCNKILHPTIRITTKCTQSCSHCCFSCSPKKDKMMAVDTARDIKRFLISNDIKIANIMGGEFFCNPDWKDILGILLPDIHARLVTNGDWAGDASVAKFLSGFPLLRVSISKDQWHTNAKVAEAARLCKKYGIKHNVATEDQTTNESIVPVGRGDLHYGLYSMFATYCHNPDNKYAFLIDEKGMVYKCSFGSWNYADIHDHLEGGFDKVFKEFNQRFCKVFIPSCATCRRACPSERRAA